MNTKNPDEEAAHLRQQAEEKLKSKPFIPPTNKSESLTNKMIHELEVHQVELEMQNEELMSAKKQIEDDIEKYTQLYDFAPSGYFTLAQDGRIIHLNLSAALMLGKERSYLINKRFGVFVDMKSIPDFNYFMEKMFLTNKKESCEISLIYNNQYPITVYLVGSLNPDGEQCSVSMVDITERREAEDALKMSEIRWHTLFEILPVGVSILDKYLDISQSNPALEKILHISHDALNRKKYNHRKYMHADGSPMEFKDFPSNIAIKEQKSVKDIIVGVEKEDGETVWTEVSAAPLHVTDSICAIVTHDITARRRQEDLFKTRLHLLAFAENNSLEEFFEETLNQAEKLTKSCIGFIHLVDEDQKTLRLQAWSTLTKKVFCKAKGLGLHYDLDKAGVWADSLRQRKPIIHNNYEKLVNKKGLPEGHAPILREMVVPVIRNNKVKALLGVGNKPNDYTLADLETISLIADLAWDITQRMMSDREIKQSEEKYRLLLENSGIGVGVFSIDGTIELFNAKAIEIIGGKLEDYIGKSVFEVFSDDVAASYMRRFHETAKSVVSIEFEDYVQFGSRTFWFLSNHTRIINAEGKVIGIQVLAHDITQRKLSEIKLLESETQYRNLANSGSALIWTSGTDKLCNFFNQPWLEFTGHSLEHEVGNGWTEGVHPDDLISCVEIYVSSFDQQKAFEMEYRLRHHSGEYRWIIDMGTPNFNSQGEFVGYIGHCFDISERKKTDQALKESEASLHYAQKIAKMGNWEYNVTSKKNTWSKNCFKLFGLEPDELDPTFEYFKSRVHPDDLYLVEEGFDKFYFSHEPMHFEMRILFPEGKQKWMLNNVAPVFHKGKLIALKGTNIDITERKLAEIALQEKMNEMQRWFDLTIDREIKMIELKKEINQLCQQLGQEDKYVIVE